jgi:hypothetical protein
MLEYHDGSTATGSGKQYTDVVFTAGLVVRGHVFTFSFAAKCSHVLP